MPDTIGDRINLVVAKYGKSGRKFCELMAISTGNLNSLINDDSKPGAKFLILILEQLGININWLLTGQGEMLLNSENTKNIAGNIAQLTSHQNLVLQFRNQALAEEITQDLKIIEDCDEEKLQDIQTFVKGVLVGVKPRNSHTNFR